MIDTKSLPDAWLAAPTIETRWPHGGVAQVVLGGEHDLSTQDQLASTLATALADRSHLVVDLSTTQFIDSSTIDVLIAIKKRAETRDRRFNLLLGTEPIVEKVLELAGVLPLLNRVHALEEAISTNTSAWPTRANSYVEDGVRSAPLRGRRRPAHRRARMTKPLPWTFLTSHALVLLSIDRRRGATVRVLAESAGVTQRQVHRIIGDLAAEGWISVKRVGRQNRYTINRRKLVRDASVTGVELGELLVALND